MSHKYYSKSSRIYIPLLLLVAIVRFGHSFHEEFRPCKKVAFDDEVAMNITTKILKVIPWTKIRDGFPFVFKHPKTDMTAIVCLPEKIASTTWKSLFIKALEYSLFESKIKMGVDPHLVRFNETKNKLNPGSARVIADAILNPYIPRIMFTRDPYSKALSGYSDKVADSKVSEVSPFDFHPGLNTSASFYEFTEYISEHSPLNEHFQPVTNRCMLPMGMRYDYYLKIENMPQWYEPLIDMLDLREEASSGWNYTSYWRPALKGEVPGQCFYTPPGKTCKDMFTYPVPNHNPLHIKRRLNNKQEIVMHVKNSGSKLKHYYNATSAKRITTFAKCDLQAFGYPEWDGTNAEKYIHSLRKLPVTTDVEQKFGCYVDKC